MYVNARGMTYKYTVCNITIKPKGLSKRFEEREEGDRLCFVSFLPLSLISLH